MTEEDIKAGKCGGGAGKELKDYIIPWKEATIPHGRYVFEFKDNLGYHGPGGVGGPQADYKQWYPGFLDPKKHPDGLCIPCCMKNNNNPKHTKLRKQCIPSSSPKRPEDDESPKQKSEYIQGWNIKKLLVPGQWRYLPLSVQKFLETDNTKCQKSPEEPGTLHLNRACLLLHGVKLNKNQSFVEAIADIFSKADDIKPAITLDEMKTKIIDSLTLDNFLTYFNGSLVQQFYKDEGDVNISEKHKKN